MVIENTGRQFTINFFGQDVTVGEAWYGARWPEKDGDDCIYSYQDDGIYQFVFGDLKWGYPAPRGFNAFLSFGTPFSIIKWFMDRYNGELPAASVTHYFKSTGEYFPVTLAEMQQFSFMLRLHYQDGKAWFLATADKDRFISDFDADWRETVRWVKENLGYNGCDINNITDEDYTAATVFLFKPQCAYLPDITNYNYGIDNLIMVVLNGALNRDMSGELGDMMKFPKICEPLPGRYPHNDSPQYFCPNIVNWGDWGSATEPGVANNFSGLYAKGIGVLSRQFFIDSRTLPDFEIIEEPDNFKDYDNETPEDDTDLPDTTGGNGYYPESKESMGPDKNVIPGYGPSETGFCHLYIPTFAQLRNLQTAIWDQDIIDYLKNMFTTNPMECIISLAMYPMDFESLGYRGDLVQCVLGTRAISHDGQAVNMYVPKNFAVGLDFGKIELRERYGSALDYSPFTSFQLFLPFIGFVEISPNDVYIPEPGNEKKNAKDRKAGYIHLQYMINLYTGDCVAYIYGMGATGIENLIATHSGNCSMQIPVTGRDYNSFYSNIANGFVRAAGNLASGKVGSAISDAVTTAISSSGGAQVQRSGGYTNGCTLISPTEPYLIRTTPQQNLAKFSEYARTNGLPYNKKRTLKNISGYTEIENLEATGFTGTDEELEEMITLLQGGVWL